MFYACRGGNLLQVLQKLHSSIEENNIYSSIRKALAMLMPALLVGAAAVSLMNLPFPGYREGLEQLFGGHLFRMLDFIQSSTFGFLAAFLVMGVSYFYSSTLGADKFARIMCIIMAFSAFIASHGGPVGSLKLENFGSIGVFSALLCSVISTKIFYELYVRSRRRFRSYWEGTDDAVIVGMSSILPYCLTLLVFVLADILIGVIFGASDINALLFGIMDVIGRVIKPNLGGGILYVFLLQLSWFLGMHGGNLFEPVHLAVFVPYNKDPDVILSKVFIDSYVLIGGCGTTVCLIIALFLFSKTRANRNMAWGALPFAVFNINEFIIFGLPVILNPIMLVPFILAPMSAMIIAYTATAAGILPISVTEGVHWTTPALFSGYMSGGVAGVVVQVVIIAAGTAIYAPFVRMSERLRDQLEAPMIQRAFKLVISLENHRAAKLLTRADDIGVLCKTMLSQLREDLENENIPVFFQPQVDCDGKMTGCEALLRWTYRGNYVPPPLAVAIAEQGMIFDALTDYIYRVSLIAMVRTRDTLKRKFKMSVNISPEQLTNTKFIIRLINIAGDYAVEDGVCLEVTENGTLTHNENLLENAMLLRDSNVSVAIDDFSMGSTSLKYLKSGLFKFVKLDGSIVKEVVSNTRSREIARSIVKLGVELGFEVVAEYVETGELRDELAELGVKYMQGFYYSRAVPEDALAEFMREH